MNRQALSIGTWKLGSRVEDWRGVSKVKLRAVHFPGLGVVAGENLPAVKLFWCRQRLLPPSANLNRGFFSRITDSCLTPVTAPRHDTVAPTIAIASDTFGKRSVSIIYRWVFVFHQIGGAVAATAAGAVRVSFGQYYYAFLAGGIMALIAAGLALSIRSPSLPPLAGRTDAARA